MKEPESIKEQYTDEYPLSSTIKGTECILKQMKNNICKIYNGNNKGTGFFLNIFVGTKIMKVFVTCNHVIDYNYYLKNNYLTISLFDDYYSKTINLKNKRIFYTNPNLDATIIEILEDDKIGQENFFELDESIINKNNDRQSLQVIYKKKPIYTCHYQNGQRALVSYGRIIELNQSSLYHLCDTQNGSSGAPILSLDKNRVIGMHIGCGKITNDKRNNEGVLILDCINDFINFLNQKMKKINIVPKIQISRNPNLKFEQLEETSEPFRKQNQNILNKENTLKRSKSFIQNESLYNNNYKQIQNQNNNFNNNNKNNFINNQNKKIFIPQKNKGNIIFNNRLRNKKPIGQNINNFNNGINNNIPTLNVIPNNYINNNNVVQNVPYKNIYNNNYINNNMNQANYLNYNINIPNNVNNFGNYNNNLNINNNLYNQNYYYVNQNNPNILYTSPT